MSTLTFSASNTVATSFQGFLSTFANILKIGTRVSRARENFTGLRHYGRLTDWSDVIELHLGDAAVTPACSAELSHSRTRPILVQILPSSILTTTSNSRLSKPSRT